MRYFLRKIKGGNQLKPLSTNNNTMKMTTDRVIALSYMFF